MTTPRQTILITGGASGIGRHLSGECLRRGWQVIACDRDAEGLARTFSGVDGAAERLLPAVLDVAVEADWQRVVAEATARFGRIDVLLNCAGIMQPGFVLDAEVASLRRMLDVNVTGQILGAQQVGRQMVKQGGGHIVQIASLAALGPVRGVAYYAASKAAVRSAMLALGMELEGSGVAVTIMCPDLVKTAMFDLQLKYPKESAVVFSGASPLEVGDISDALFHDVLPNRPLEVYLPANRGLTARLGGIFPALSRYMQRRLAAKGEAAILQRR
ncbi:SDR family NAD(P)-dependent oxidoreductase [Jeongeupia wiesaeckerbachi]|uniref:SDR family NAD(P)-dependent oxidoreductase n=1 Tax=Jeongeupia wiesaeckerbachi TaxID=3051218 RepID=UPI003D808FBC